MSQDNQSQTGECFAFKWAKRETYESEAVRQKAYHWMVQRYFGGEEQRDAFLQAAHGKSLLDAGCGGGFSAMVLFADHLAHMHYYGVDISAAVETARQRFAEQGLSGTFLQRSLTELKLGRTFDIVFCEGVLHHTSAPRVALSRLVEHLNPGGTILFYVYRRKAPLREFCDDHIRERLRAMSDEEAWRALLPLTRLGRNLGRLDVEVEVEEDVELLGIPKGKYPLQRLVYWFFAKMYYDPHFSDEEMNHINFDWYRPLNCFRFTPEEVRSWIAEEGLVLRRFVAEEAGITVVADKP